jgi:hypothetical protein
MTVTIRSATDADAAPLRRLALLSCDPPLDGDVLIAEVDGEPLAACSVDTGRTISNAFRHTHDLRPLLELRRKQLSQRRAA